jgi:DNA replication initiation complex subunit (GINS family)
MEENTIETLRQLLIAEEASESLTKLPSNIYSTIAVYAQKLRKAADPTSDDLVSRLTRKQLWLLEGMARQLLSRRLAKATSGRDTKDLLPEERYVCGSYAEFERIRNKFIKAMVNGQSSFFAILQKQQMQKMVTVRFLKPLGEVIGFDLNRYGPFKAHDVAHIPAGNAEALISNGDAAMIYTKDSF